MTVTLLTVLCVDDSPQVLERRKTALESDGYCVKVASSTTPYSCVELAVGEGA